MAAAANVDVTAVVPVAAVNVTFTPVCQLVLFNVTLAGLTEIAVLPERVRVTVTLPEGAALSRMLDVPVAPLASVSDVGLAVMVGVTVPWIVNDTTGVDVLSAGVPLSKAVACAV